MARTIDARVSSRTEYKVAKRACRGASAFALAMDLIPAKGIKQIQSESLRELAEAQLREKGR